MPQCYQSIVIQAPVEKVWEAIKNFHDLSWGANVIAKCEAVGALPGTEVGAIRILNDVFHETLLECNDSKHRIRYSIDDGPSPVSRQEVANYIGTIQLFPVTADNTTFVSWSSVWQAKDSQAVDFCQPIYSSLLQDLALTLNSGSAT
jgi:Polyketide cyclase / dehydrase and lipid transport